MAGDDAASPTERLGAGEPPGPGAPWRLVVLRDDRVSHHVLPAQGAVSLGRGDDAVVQVAHRSVSRLHAMIHVLGDRLLLEELGSANGTRLRGGPLVRGEPVALARGDVVELGSVTVLVDRGGSPGAPTVAEPGASQDELDRMVRRVAQGAISVLLVGETGAGKDVLANRLHALSRRAGRPLVKLNCAALTESLLESELFGHEQGAFTGALSRKLGLLETAHGGTVFLDEIGELAPATQAKLLRVLEDRTLIRVGGVAPIEVDLRVISATHRDLEADIAAGRFRRDLYFRIAAITLAIPPLRRRLRELPALAAGFIAEACRREARPAVELSRPALALLERHPWPGNIRELRNVVERAVLLCDGPAILPEHVQLAAERPRAPVPGGLREDVGSFELDRIREALAASGGNQTRAAALLGISRRTLVSRLTRAGLTRPRKR